jgi:Skp family chaperone for outer membrane proteins
MVAFWVGSSVLMATDSHAADPQVVVVDVRAAVVGSALAQKKMETLRAELADEETSFLALAKEIKELQEQFRKDEVVLSADDKRRMEKQIQDKLAEHNFLREKLQKNSQDAQQQLLQEMLPHVEKAILALQSEKKYTMILRREAALWVAEELDITPIVIEAINKTSGK